jgi:hypothetical protein
MFSAAIQHEKGPPFVEPLSRGGMIGLSFIVFKAPAVIPLHDGEPVCDRAALTLD